MRDKKQKDLYAFYDKSQKEEEQEEKSVDNVDIYYPAPAPTEFNY